MQQIRPSVDFTELFETVRTIAVVGYSDKKERAGHFVPAYLAQHGYQIIAVNPRLGDKVDGFPCYPGLAEIPAGTQVDVVDVFRAPEYVEAIAEETLRMEPRPRYFWMQPGAENEAAAARLAAEGVLVIMDDCMLARHRALFSR